MHAKERGLGRNQPCPCPALGLPASRNCGQETLWFKLPCLWDLVQQVLLTLQIRGCKAVVCEKIPPRVVGHSGEVGGTLEDRGLVPQDADECQNSECATGSMGERV